MPEEVFSSMGESGTRNSLSFSEGIIRNVMSKYHLSYYEAKIFVSRMKSKGLKTQNEYLNEARKQSNRKIYGGI